MRCYAALIVTLCNIKVTAEATPMFCKIGGLAFCAQNFQCSIFKNTIITANSFQLKDRCSRKWVYWHSLSLNLMVRSKTSQFRATTGFSIKFIILEVILCE